MTYHTGIVAAGPWATEENFWLEGPNFYRAHLAEGAEMTFPDAVGTVRGAAIIDALQNAPRWGAVSFEDKKMSVEDGRVVLRYRATARRDGQPDYRAQCISIYRSEPSGLKLEFHRQDEV